MSPEEPLLSYRIQRLEDGAQGKADAREVERLALALERYTARMDTLIEKYDLRLDAIDKSKADVASLRWMQRTAVTLLLALIGASVGFGFAALTELLRS